MDLVSRLHRAERWDGGDQPLENMPHDLNAAADREKGLVF